MTGAFPSRPRRIRIGLPVLLLLLTACPQETAVWVAPGSTARNLTFVLGHKPGRERRISAFLRVERCGDYARYGYNREAMWLVQVDTSRVTYGQPGPAAREDMQARPLVPGCYHAHVSGTGQTAFTVDSAGAVTELDSVPTS